LNRQDNPRPRLDLGVFGLLIALIVLAFIARFLRDSLGIAYGSLLSLIWMAITIVTFLFALIYYAQFISPLQGSEGWSEGLRLLIRSYSRLIGRLIIGDAGGRPPGTLPLSLTILDAGIIRSFQALAITKVSRYMRALGPGFVMLNRKERIRQVIDLRPQRRAQAVEANTRDGIPLQTSVSVIFRVRWLPPDQIEPDMIFPYDKEAIFHITYANAIGEQDQELPWTEQLTPRAAALLVRELAHHELNELLQSVDGMSQLDEIKRKIHRDLQRTFAQYGVEVLSVGVGAFELPESVQEQHIKAWQAEWQRKIKIEHATGDAEATRRIKQAKARAQVEIIENIIQSIEAMRQENDSDLTQIITLRMIEALEESISDGLVHSPVPHQIMATLVTDAVNELRSWVDPATLIEADTTGAGESEEADDTADDTGEGTT
jgi:regulator of protease activity HflC (stomatin/prohibitin superfamily)